MQNYLYICMHIYNNNIISSVCKPGFSTQPSDIKVYAVYLHLMPVICYVGNRSLQAYIRLLDQILILSDLFVGCVHGFTKILF